MDLSLYGYHVYKAVSPMVDAMAYQLGQRMERAGFQALPVPSSQYRAVGERIGLFSHKLAAHLAGLGWIGKNTLLITPQFGPRVRLATVLTDGELEGGHREDERCGACQKCVEACPVGALTGREFHESEGVEARLDVEKCGTYRDGAGSGAKRGAHVCGLCLAVCPKAYSQDPA